MGKRVAISIEGQGILIIVMNPSVMKTSKKAAKGGPKDRE